MPRKPRIELAGKYHIINRGVAQMHIFKEPVDYEYFEELTSFPRCTWERILQPKLPKTIHLQQTINTFIIVSS